MSAVTVPAGNEQRMRADIKGGSGVAVILVGSRKRVDARLVNAQQTTRQIGGAIVEFWRRWHISLSRFLRDYLYIPLGGSRAGFARRYANLMITMVLGGLWHGAAWTFAEPDL